MPTPSDLHFLVFFKKDKTYVIFSWNSCKWPRKLKDLQVLGLEKNDTVPFKFLEGSCEGKIMGKGPFVLMDRSKAASLDNHISMLNPNESIDAHELDATRLVEEDDDLDSPFTQGNSPSQVKSKRVARVLEEDSSEDDAGYLNGQYILISYFYLVFGHFFVRKCW